MRSCCLHNWLNMCAHYYMQLGSFSTTAADVAFAATRDASAIAWLTGRSEVRAVPAARITNVTIFTATVESLCAHPHTFALLRHLSLSPPHVMQVFAVLRLPGDTPGGLPAYTKPHK